MSRKNSSVFGLVMLLSTVVVVDISLAQGTKAQSQAAAKEMSLYKRLGGYDAIAAVVDDFVPRLAGDPDLAQFFNGHSIDTKKRLRQHVVDLICELTGGPCMYVGRDLKTAHAGLGIAESHWQTSLKHFNATLDKFSVPPKEMNELISLISALKPKIVEKP